jgi:beta-mannosidase
MKEYYPIPQELEDFVYTSQLLQAEGIRTGIESHRRKKPYCMGTLYWQLNDCWPAISWSSLDYYKNKKALHYFVKEDFKNTMLSIKKVQDSLHFYIINDAFTALKGNLDVKLFLFNGKGLKSQRIPITTCENSSVIVHKSTIEDLTKNYDPNQIVLFSTLKTKDTIIDENFFYFSKPKFLTLKDPSIKIMVKEKDNNEYDVYLRCEYFAKNVYLNSLCEGYFSNNYFDMIPGRVYKTTFSAQESCNIFEKHLKVNCLNGIEFWSKR